MRKYFSSIVSLKYSFILTGLALVIFVCSFLYLRGNTNLRYAVLIVAILLVVVLCLYYHEKYRNYKQCNAIKDLKDFENSIEFDDTFLLENRMLTYGKNGIVESDYSNLQSLSMEVTKDQRVKMHLKINDQDFAFRVLTKDQGQRVAAFLKRKALDLQLLDIDPVGQGTWDGMRTTLKQ